jgi:hypothetical protein
MNANDLKIFYNEVLQANIEFDTLLAFVNSVIDEHSFCFRHNTLADFLIQDSAVPTALTELELKLFEIVDSYGGYEGAGEEYYTVFKVVPYNRFLKQTGIYTSYDGVQELSKLYEVWPREVVNTVYQ